MANGQVASTDSDEAVSALQKLAELIDNRNEIARRITDLIGRPALIGHIGEFIASEIFRIQLEDSATNKGSDGTFRDDPLKGKTVNVKFYGYYERILDIRLDAVPDFYLVMTGPKGAAPNSKGAARLWHIDKVFLFHGSTLVEHLKVRNVKIGVATSVISAEWEKAEIYPSDSNPALRITEEQRTMLQFFHSGGDTHLP